MRKNILFRGIATALATPFRDGEVDLDAFGALIDRQKGVNALVVAGTTGEAPTLSEKERDALLSLALARTDGRVPVIMGAGSNDTAHAVRLTKRAAALGANAVLSVTPYYNKGTRAGLRTHFLHVAEASDAPVILYNVPSRTGISLSLADYETLAAHPNICGIKESEENGEKFTALAAHLGGRVGIYSGSDSFFLPALSLGADGLISVASNLLPSTFAAIFDAFEAGDVHAARLLYAPCAPLIRLLFEETSPAPLKEALLALGIGDGECRLPLSRPEASLAKRLRDALAALAEEPTVKSLDFRGII